MRALATWVIIAGLWVGTEVASAAAPKTRTYTVQPGDSIWSIAEEFYGHGNKYRIIYEHNKFIGEPPFILKPGQVLTLPPGQVSPEAQVEWTRREVKAKPPKSLDWLKANNKMNLWKLYQVSTGGDSAVHIVFEDRSDLRMGEDALMVIYSGSSKSAKTREQQKTQVLLKEGTVRGGLAALDGPAPAAKPGAPPPPPPQPMVVETPSGVIELMSTLAQVQADASAAVVSVYEGKAAVKGAGETVEVKKGQGTVVAKGKKPEAPTPLPPAPSWDPALVDPGQGLLALVPEGGRASVQARWLAVSEAKTYRVELAHDEAFKQIAVGVEVPAETLSMSLDNIPAGKYFARVSARDRRKLEGEPSPVLPVDVVAVASSRRMALEDGRWEVVALTRLGLGPAGAGFEWALDGGAFVAGTEPLRVVRPGEAKVRARRVGGAKEASFVFTMLPVTVSFSGNGVPVSERAPVLAVGGEPLTLGLTLTDPRGLPAPLPDISLIAEPALGEGPIALREVGPGRYEATLPAPATPIAEKVAVKVAWLDGSLGGVEVAVDASTWKVPYVYRWREALPAPSWDGRRGATPMPSIRPIDRVGVGTRVMVADGEGHVGVALGGELALGPSGEVGLDAELTLFRPPLSRDGPQENEVGDLVLGARWLVLREPRWTVAPSLRARVPLTTRGATDGVAGERTLGIEPGVLVRHRMGRDLWLDMRQAVLIAEDLGDGGGEGRIGWVSDYAALVRVDRAWALAGLAALDVPLSGGGDVGVGVGLGGFFTADRFRVGLQLGFGLTEGAWSRSGDLTLGLSLDVGLGTP